MKKIGIISAVLVVLIGVGIFAFFALTRWTFTYTSKDIAKIEYTLQHGGAGYRQVIEITDKNVIENILKEYQGIRYIRVSNDITLGGYFDMDCFGKNDKSIFAFSSSDGVYVDYHNIYKALPGYEEQLKTASENTKRIINELLESGNYQVITK